MLVGGCVFLEVIALVDFRQSVPSVATQLRQSNAQNSLAFQRMNQSLEGLVRVELPKVLQAQSQTALVFRLIHVLHFAILKFTEKLVNQFIVAHESLFPRAFFQSSIVNIDLGELQRRLDLIIFRRQRKVRDELLCLRVVLTLEIIAVWHVSELRRLFR
jgi:hypothetical protein